MGFLYFQGILAFALQVFALQAALQRGGKRYRLLVLYLVSLLLGTVVNLSLLQLSQGRWSIASRQYFWAMEFVQHLLVFSAIIGFTYQRMIESARARRLARWLILGAIGGVFLSLWIHYDARLNLWMTSVNRNLSFVAMLLNFVLWTTLLKDPDRNSRMLMISGGLGVQLAGEALGHGLRLLSSVARPLLQLGNWIFVLTYFISLFLIYRAFHHPERRALQSA